MDNPEKNNNISEDNNVGNWNAGIGNCGNCNCGDCNIGDFNVGIRNCGNCNCGDRNTGSWNRGDWNTGIGNSGNYNTGDFNLTSGSTGCCNTIEPTISFFNQPSDWTMSQWWESEARRALCELKACPVVRIDEKDMSEEEKQEHPEYTILTCYLKERSKEEQIAETVEKWKALSDEKKRLVMSIPNFDKEIFKQITGIDVDS